MCLAHVVDEFGPKMSKSKGNVLDPWHIFDTFGADALRWYFFSAGSPWTNRRVYEDGIREATRKTLITLWNVFAFFATYADLAGWDAAGRDAADGRTSDGDWDPADAEPGPRARPLGARPGWRRPWRPSPTPSTTSTPWAGPPPWPPSSTTCRTGTSAGHGPASGDRPGALRTRRLRHAVPVPTVVSQLLAPFCPFLADELYVT